MTHTPSNDDAPRLHWEQVYTTKATNDVSWFEEQPTTSMELVQSVSDSLDSVIDIGAGAAFLADHLLATGYRDVTVLDVSAAALENVRIRFRDATHSPSYVVADVTDWIPNRMYDVWHDRAVYHFMVTDTMREGYKRSMRSAVRQGGFAIVATFALNGPEQCSGITVRRHSAESLTSEFSDDFDPVSSTDSVHLTPWGSEQHFVWAILRRR